MIELVEVVVVISLLTLLLGWLIVPALLVGVVLAIARPP